MKMKMIDPPSGWKYGFPKPIPEDVKDVNAWLVKEGYPQKEIDNLGKYFYCRYWEINQCRCCGLRDGKHKMDCSER